MTAAEIEPRSGVAFLLRRGQVLRVIDPEGVQVADLLAYSIGLTEPESGAAPLLLGGDERLNGFLDGAGRHAQALRPRKRSRRRRQNI